jgi:hypothetical protein
MSGFCRKDASRRCCANARRPGDFLPHGLKELWQAMEKAKFTSVRRNPREALQRQALRGCEPSIPLGREEIGELWPPPSYDWKEVEPAIFGTFLEQALDPDGACPKLGAHYTPRAYVERLVVETVIEPLRAGLAARCSARPSCAKARRRRRMAHGRGLPCRLCERACSIPPAAPATSSMCRWS